MIHYPLVSIVLIGSGDLPHLQASFDAVKRIRYPRDQIELFLIMPPQRPVPHGALEGQMATKIIQFDTGLPWNEQEARLEGMNLASGEYVQLLGGDLALHPDWLQSALPYFLHHQVFGVRGKIQSKESAEKQASGWFRTKTKQQTVSDGLYDRKILQYLKLKRQLISRPMADYFPAPQKVLNLPIDMAYPVPKESGNAPLAKPWQHPFRRIMQKIVPSWIM